MSRTHTRKGDWVVAGGRPGESGHCTRCGEGLTLGTQRIGVAVAAMKAFVEAHAHCKETGYQEPIPKTPEEWATSREVGVSSGTIYAAVTGRLSPYPAHWDVPHDAADFARCYRLLKLFPALRPDLPKVVNLCAKWKPFVAAWDELSSLYEEGPSIWSSNGEAFYRRIQQLEKEGSMKKAIPDNELFAKVQQIIEEQLGVDYEEITPKADFVNDLGADSLDTVELVMAFEEAFDIEIPDEDAEKVRTVQDAVDYLRNNANVSRPER